MPYLAYLRAQLVKANRVPLLLLLLMVTQLAVGRDAWRRNLCALTLADGVPLGTGQPISAGTLSLRDEEICPWFSAFLIPAPLTDVRQQSRIVVFHQGMVRWRDGDLIEALAVWQLEPRIGVYWYNSGVKALEDQLFEVARVQLGIAWQLAPDGYRARTAFALAKVLAQLDRADEALHYYREAAAVSSLQPAEEVVARQAAWQVAMTQADYVQALAVAQDLIEDRTQDASSWIRLGQTYLSMGRAEDAIVPLQRGLQLAGSTNDVVYLLARAYREVEDFERSLAALDQIQGQMRDWRYYFELARTLHSAGCESSAQAQWRIAQQLNRKLDLLSAGKPGRHCALSGYH